MADMSPKTNDDFPEWYSVDDDGLSSLVYFLRKHYSGCQVLIAVKAVEYMKLNAAEGGPY